MKVVQRKMKRIFLLFESEEDEIPPFPLNFYFIRESV